MKDDLQFLRLWDLYSPMLTATQQEITNLYFNFDLSLGEIAEQKGVSRQSVSDCLQKCRKQLEKFEAKLGFSKMLDDLSLEYSAYMTVVEHWIEAQRKSGADEKPLAMLEDGLLKMQQAFGSERIELEDGSVVVGKTVDRDETQA